MDDLAQWLTFLAAPAHRELVVICALLLGFCVLWGYVLVRTLRRRKPFLNVLAVLAMLPWLASVSARVFINYARPHTLYWLDLDLFISAATLLWFIPLSALLIKVAIRNAREKKQGDPGRGEGVAGAGTDAPAARPPGTWPPPPQSPV